MKRTSLHTGILRYLNSNRTRLAVLTGLLMFSSSCTTARQYVQSLKREPKGVAESPDKDKAIADAADKAKTDPKSKSGESQPVKTASAQDQPKTLAEPSQELPKPDISALIAKGEDPFAASASRQSDIQQTSVQSLDAPGSDSQILKKWAEEESQNPFAVKAAAEVPQGDAVQLQAEPRLAANGPEGCPPNWGGSCPPGIAAGPAPFPSVEELGDEYVCDGGDKNLPVHYDGHQRAGLDSEDTVIEYVDNTGEKHVQPSTTACLYAPRFGAVRSSTLPETGVTVDKVAGHHDETKLAGLNTRLVPDEQRKADEAVGFQMRERAGGLEGRAADQKLQQNVAAVDHVKLLNAYEEFLFVREGQFDKADSAVIGQALQAAYEWADGRRAIIVAHDQAGQMVQARATAQDMTGIEDRRKKGELCIVKVADKAAAHPGDVVTFTIRFDNVGDRELYGVRVVDNLSPRLKFVEGSIQSNLDGLVDVTENGAGGELLTFEFDKPLQGKTGGHVTFKCTVR